MEARNAWVTTIAAAIQAALAAAEDEDEAPPDNIDAAYIRSPTPASWGEDIEASADAGFSQAMHDKGMVVMKMEGDGNCLFRSVADQVFGDPGRHPQASVVEKEKIPAE